MEVAIKMVVVGNGAVGKSSMIQRYCKGIFTKDYKKTIGVDFLERQIQYVLGHFILWVLVCEPCPTTASERRWLVTAQTLGGGWQRRSVTHSFVCLPALLPPPPSLPVLSFFFFFATLLPFFYVYVFYIYWWHLGHILNSLIEYLVVLGLSVAQGLWLQLACSVAPWLVALGSLARLEPLSPVLQVGLLTARPQGRPIAGAS